MLSIIYLFQIFLIQPLLGARAGIQKHFCWFFGSNEKVRICFRDRHFFLYFYLNPKIIIENSTSKLKSFHDIFSYPQGAVDRYNCIYVKPQTGQSTYKFDIMYDQCGSKPDLNGRFYENNIVIQYDKDLIEVSTKKIKKIIPRYTKVFIKGYCQQKRQKVISICLRSLNTFL